MICETKSVTHPIHGVKRLPGGSWQIWSHVLKHPLYSRSATDARRIVTALATLYTHSVPVDYSEVDAAITADRPECELTWVSPPAITFPPNE
jgi:hypothetical protein